jgi:hypothetical protein
MPHKEAMVNLEVSDGKAFVKFYATAEYAGTKEVLRSSFKTHLERTIDISPAKPFLT